VTYQQCNKIIPSCPPNLGFEKIIKDGGRKDFIKTGRDAILDLSIF
jgi:hypothetical protein